MYTDLIINEILNSDLLKFQPFSKEKSNIIKSQYKPSIVTIMDNQNSCCLIDSLAIIDDIITQTDINSAYENKVLQENIVRRMINTEKIVVVTTVVLHVKNRGYIRNLNLELFENRFISFYFFEVPMSFSI